jgi:hypothetical protein
MTNLLACGEKQSLLHLSKNVLRRKVTTPTLRKCMPSMYKIVSHPKVTTPCGIFSHSLLGACVVVTDCLVTFL